MPISSRHYTRRVEVFPNFEGGEVGRRTFVSPRRAGQFHATNMIVDYQGHLTVRPGLKKITLTGVSNGIVKGFGGTPVPGRDTWYVQGTTLTYFSVSGGAVSNLAGHLASTPTYSLDWVGLGTQIYFPNVGDGTYVFNPVATTATLTKLTGSPGGRCITAYNDRLVVGSVNTPDNMIQWNGLTAGVSDFNAWPSSNRAQIGDPWVLTAIDWQRNHLLIAKQNQWHILTGQFGADGDFSNLAVRKVSSSPGPLNPLATALNERDIVWYQSIFGEFPSEFNGTYATHHRDINYAGFGIGNSDTFPVAVGVAPLGIEAEGAVYVTSASTAALYNHGVWTEHTFGVATSGQIFTDLPNGGGSRLVMSDGGGAASLPSFYTWDLSLDRPGLASGQFDQPGDNTTTPIAGTVTFPEWWAQDVAEVQVRSVIVDFSAYANGSGGNDGFTLGLNVLRRYESGDLASSTQTYAAPASGFSASGTRMRKIFGFNDAGLGNGFSMQFTNVQGISIERIEVVLEDHPVRMGT